MATFYSTQDALGREVPSRLMDRGYDKGIVRVIYRSYTTDGTEANGDLIQVGRLGPAQRVIGGKVHQDGLGTSVTLALGDSVDADRYFTAQAAATAGNIDIDAFAGLGYEGGAADLFLTIGGADPDASKTVKAVILVVED